MEEDRTEDAKLSVYLIKRNAMVTDTVMEIWIRTFLTYALDEDEAQLHAPVSLHVGARLPVPNGR